MMKVKNLRFLATLLFVSPALVHAMPMIDFTGLTASGDARTNLGTASTSYGSPLIEIDGFWYDGSTWSQNDDSSGNPVTLFARVQTNDNGLGVCSPGQQSNSACDSSTSGGGGDFNELDNADNEGELIRLTLPDNFLWTDLWVSSLDAGDADGNEEGRLYWSNNGDPNAISGATSFFDFSYLSQFQPLGTVEGALDLTGSGFNAATKYLFFSHDPFRSSIDAERNDYLLWGVGVRQPPSQIPEPAILVLMGIGLAGLGGLSRRRAKA